jgi:hypothetical protein
MGQGFKEVAILRGDDKKYESNFNNIDWGGTVSEKTSPLVLKEEERFISVSLTEIDEFIAKYPTGLISLKIFRELILSKDKGRHKETKIHGKNGIY